jgi:dipeptidyl aminopeptidase/acylaminoacyl peptidase
MKRALMLLLALFIATAALAEKRNLTAADFGGIRDVGTPRLSPDGNWIVYTVRQPSFDDDKNHRHLWLASADGKESTQLTFSDASESSPRWSRDGSRIAFLSSRGVEDENDQLWIMNRIGGEAEKVTSVDGSVVDFDWSPDGKRVVLAVEDADPKPPKKTDDTSASKKKSDTKPPIVINRYRFKQDINGYLTEKRQHLYLFDVASRTVEPLTPGVYSEYLPSWSPDGAHIAFVSKRGDEPDRSDNWDVFIIDPKSGATVKQLTTYTGADNAPGGESRLAWSPDAKSIAYVRGGDPKLIYYAVRHLAVVSLDGKETVITGAIDRNLTEPVWSSDGKSLYATMEEDRVESLVRVPLDGGAMQTLAGGRRTVVDYDVAGNRIVIVTTDTQHPAELAVIDNGSERRLTHHNDSFLSGIRLGAVEEIEFPSKDATRVRGFLVTPPAYAAGTRVPTILRIHGGPVSQFTNAFSFEWQLLAANGYAVVGANPRGSSGRGEKYSTAIWADWGHLDAQDVLAAVDYAIQRGVADPARLGVGGWSYGGMLTNYVIAQDKRFKAATSGASIANILAGYGTDEYVLEYEYELGQPWKNTETWMKISFPFLHADRIVTPTLFLAGDKDFNVPLLNSEQMYQALRSLAIPTELIIYPGQFHGISKPSYVKDRYERYLAWYAKYIHGSS